MLIKERLKLFIDHLQLTNQHFESECGLGNGYVANIRKGIGIRALKKITSTYPELNKRWLLTGEGQMLSTDTNDKKQTTKEKIEQDYLEIIKRQAAQIEQLQEQIGKLIEIIAGLKHI